MTTALIREQAPDLVLFNGKVTTFVNELPQCSALACKDGRIVAIGDDARVLALAAASTRQINLHGPVSYTHLDVYKRQATGRVPP